MPKHYKTFNEFMRAKTHGIAVTGTQYKKLRSEWRKISGYRSPVTKLAEFAVGARKFGEKIGVLPTIRKKPPRPRTIPPVSPREPKKPLIRRPAGKQRWMQTSTGKMKK